MGGELTCQPKWDAKTILTIPLVLTTAKWHRVSIEMVARRRVRYARPWTPAGSAPGTSGELSRKRSTQSNLGASPELFPLFFWGGGSFCFPLPGKKRSFLAGVLIPAKGALFGSVDGSCW